MLTVRSPTTETSAAAIPMATNVPAGTSSNRPADRANSVASATPPITPSQVLAGLTRGASLTRPQFPPTKCPPTSAAHTMNMMLSVRLGPWTALPCRWVSRNQAGNRASGPVAPTRYNGMRRGRIRSASAASPHQQTATAMIVFAVQPRSSPHLAMASISRAKAER